MKTRVIQDGPDEQPADKPPADPVQPQRPMNLAARMARWSAHHRKKAIFGWLALAVALFAVSILSPMKTIIFESSGAADSGRA
jgi:hypothetical protein